jgi:hypothetical protein
MIDLHFDSKERNTEQLEIIVAGCMILVKTRRVL